jgi:hypothetical protein
MYTMMQPNSPLTVHAVTTGEQEEILNLILETKAPEEKEATQVR